MISDNLRKAVLQAAIQGKLTVQLPKDGDARDLLEEIKTGKSHLIKEGKIKKEKPLPMISQDEIPFDIPDNWCWVRLGEISLFENGDRSAAYPKSSDLVKVGVPFFGAADMVDGLLSYKSVRFISEKKFSSLRSGKLIDQDFVCLLRGSIGKTAKFEETEKYKTGFINAQMVIIRFISMDFLNYFEWVFKSPSFINFINDVHTGTAVKQLPAGTLRKFIIPLPPLEEQQRIVEKLEEILPEIEILSVDENKLDTLQQSFPGQIKSSILQTAIQGKLTVQLPEDGDARDLLEENKAEKMRFIKQGKIKKEKPLPEITKDEIPFDIPENWSWVRLGEVGIWSAGATPLRSNSKYYKDGTIPWVRTGDLNDGLILEAPEYITGLALRETSVNLQPVGTVLIAMYGATIADRYKLKDAYFLWRIYEHPSNKQMLIAFFIIYHNFDSYRFFVIAFLNLR